MAVQPRRATERARRIKPRSGVCVCVCEGGGGGLGGKGSSMPPPQGFVNELRKGWMPPPLDFANFGKEIYSVAETLCSRSFIACGIF